METIGVLLKEKKTARWTGTDVWSEVVADEHLIVNLAGSLPQMFLSKTSQKTLADLKCRFNETTTHTFINEWWKFELSFLYQWDCFKKHSQDHVPCPAVTTNFADLHKLEKQQKHVIYTTRKQLFNGQKQKSLRPFTRILQVICFCIQYIFAKLKLYPAVWANSK